MEWTFLFIVGIAAGVLGSLVGLGGGIFLVPSLLLLGTYTTFMTDMSPQIAVGTSLLVIIFTGLSSTLSYMKHKTVDYKSGLIFFAGSGPGGILGAWVNKYLNADIFTVYFGFFMIIVSLLLMIRGRLKAVDKIQSKGIVGTYINDSGETEYYGYNPIIGISIAVVVGFCSGLFGIGGGSLMVPAMILLFRFPAHIAIATSMFMIFLSAIISSLTHIQLGNINWSLAVVLIPGAWIGAKIGAFLNQRLKGNTLVILLRIILIIIGLRMIFQGV